MGVLPVAPVLGPARGLDVGHPPRLGAERAQEGGGVEGPRPHFRRIGLVADAAARGPEAFEREDHVLQVSRRLHDCHVAFPGERGRSATRAAGGSSSESRSSSERSPVKRWKWWRRKASITF